MPHFDDANDASEAKPRNVNPLWSLLGWALAIVTVYLLSSGPAMFHRGKFLPQLYYKLYGPVLELYWSSPLRKPLGVYWHLWNRDLYDSAGNAIPIVVPD